MNLYYTVLLLNGEENHGCKRATQRVAGKKIKGRGGGIKSDPITYTPALECYLKAEMMKRASAACDECGAIVKHENGSAEKEKTRVGREKKMKTR